MSEYRAGGTMLCPVCKSQARARTSETLTDTCRHINYRCTNEDCGCRFMAALEVIRLLRPSDLPGVRCTIPLSANYRPQVPANDTSEARAQIV